MQFFENHHGGSLFSGYLKKTTLLAGFGGMDDLQKSRKAETLWNGLSMNETDPSTTNGWILQFSSDWHCTSLKNTAVNLHFSHFYGRHLFNMHVLQCTKTHIVFT